MIRFYTLLLFSSLYAFAPAASAAEYGKAYIGDLEKIRTKYEDTFIHLALDNNLGYVEMRAANPYVDPWGSGGGHADYFAEAAYFAQCGEKGIGD